MIKESHIAAAFVLLLIAACGVKLHISHSIEIDLRWLSAAATLLFFIWFPGRVTLSFLNIASGFDRAGRIIMSCAWSLALSPIVLNVAWHWTNNGRVLVALCGFFWVILGLLALPRRDRASPPAPAPPPFARRKTTIFVLALIAIILFVGAVGNYWPDTYQGYPVPAVIHDYIKHHAVLFSLEQRPLPLGNPFFARGAAEPTYYYHFFYLLPATVRAASGNQISIALAFGFAGFLVAIVFTGVAYLMAQRWCGGEGPATLVAILCGCVGGFDIVPLLLERKIIVTLDAWADTPLRVHNLLTQFIWTPQNMLGLLITLTGASLLSLRGWWRGWIIVGPLLCHALIGSSLWIAAAVLPTVALLVLVEIIRNRVARTPSGRFFAAALVTAVLMFVVSTPLLRDYAEVSRRHGKGLTLDWERHTWNSYFGRAVPAGPLANWLDYPWLMLVEFGPLLIVPLLMPRSAWRRAWENPSLRFLMLASILAILAYPTVRSHFTYNDFGHRIIMLPMITGAFLSGFAIVPRQGQARWFDPFACTMAAGRTLASRRVRAAILASCLVLGSPVSWWQAPMGALRRFAGHVPVLARISTPITRLAQQDGPLLRHLRALPGEAVVQADTSPQRLELAQLTGHQVGIMPLEQDTHVFQGPDASAQVQALERFEAAVQSENTTPRELYDTLRWLGVTHVLVSSVERERWKAIDAFENTELFEEVLDSDAGKIIGLR